MTEQSLSTWVKQEALNRHERDDGLTRAEREELRALRCENAQHKQERDLLKGAAALFAAETGSAVSVYRMIEAEKATEGVPVSRACELLGVSRSGYHKWQTRPPSDRAMSDAWLIEKITEIHKANAASTALRATTPSCACRTRSVSGASGWSA